MTSKQLLSAILNRLRPGPVSIFLALASPLSVHVVSAQTITVKDVRALVEKQLKVGEAPKGWDLSCAAYANLPGVVSFYKSERNDLQSTPELCEAVTAFGTHLQTKVLPFWPLTERFGIAVERITNRDDFNASFQPRPILAKQSQSQFSFLYLEGTAIGPQIGVWSHEAGHAALNEIISDHFYGIAVEAYIKSQEERIRNPSSWQRLTSLRRQEKMTADTQRRAAISFRISALENTLEMKDPADSVVVAPFHEFFADLFAAFLHNDPNITGDSHE